MSMELSAQREVLHHLTRTDPDPRVRRRAHALLVLSRGQSVMAVARLFETAPHRVRAWRSRFLIGGRQGLADAPRTGRPPKLDAAALAFLEEALEASPQTYGLPVTIWSIRDLRAVLAQRLGVRVCTATVHRAVQRLGYRYRRPRHDLRHRQDLEAVAAAEQVLAWLRKKHWRPQRTPSGLPRRMRDPWSSPPGKNVATARVSSEDPSGRGGSQVRCLRGAGLCLRANRVAAQPAQGWAGLRGLPRSPCVHARRWSHDCRAGQCRLPQGSARQGLVDDASGSRATVVAASLCSAVEPDGARLGLRQGQAQLPSLVGRWSCAGDRDRAVALPPPGTVPPARSRRHRPSPQFL